MNSNGTEAFRFKLHRAHTRRGLRDGSIKKINMLINAPAHPPPPPQLPSLAAALCWVIVESSCEMAAVTGRLGHVRRPQITGPHLPTVLSLLVFIGGSFSKGTS